MGGQQPAGNFFGQANPMNQSAFGQYPQQHNQNAFNFMK